MVMTASIKQATSLLSAITVHSKYCLQ